MNLEPRTNRYVGQREFLRNSVGLEFKTAGATLDAAAFGNVVVNAGTAVYLGDDDLYKPWGAETAATVAGAGLTAHDVEITGGNVIVGVLAAGHPLEDRCTGVTETFKEATRGRIVFDI